MAEHYVLMTDSDSDLPASYAKEHGIPVVRMPYALLDVEYFDDNGASGSEKAFYAKMRQGAAPSTSLLPTAAYLEYFEPILQHSDLLFLAFSSKMSATFQNVLEAQRELQEKYPHRKFVVVDTYSISYPQALLVYEAQRMVQRGASLEEVAQWVTDNRTRAQVWFTVDDLVYLRRGGRVSSTSAIFGTMLNIKPVLTLTKEGKLEAYAKVQGTKKAMHALVEKVQQYIQDPEDQEVLIMHADAEENAELLKKLLLQKVPQIKEAKLVMIGPVIGAHAGPGTLAITFMGQERPV